MHHSLIIVLLLDRTRRKNVPSGTVLVLAVLKRQLAEGSNHVLNRRVLAATVLATESVEPLNAVEQVVNDGDDDGNTDGVSPDNDNGDNVNPAVITEPAVDRGRVGLVWCAGHPAEKREDGRESVDTQDSDDQLEGGEGLAATGNEDQPVLSESNLKEEDGLNGTEVLDDTTVGQEKSTTNDPGTEGK